MDDIKDVAKKDHLSRFLDSTAIRTDAFGENVSGERAYRRAERIAAALHLLTNHIPHDEPVRGAARSAAIILLSSTLKLRDELRSRESQALKSVEGLIRKLISLTRILSVSGRVSMQNADVLIAALDELGVYLTMAKRSGLSESTSLNKDDFALATHTSGLISDTRRRKKARQIKDKLQQSDSVSDKGSPTHGRAEEVVAVLGSHGQLGIKDIAANLPEYSEKMIQRELKNLVLQGRVKKMGAKRWSTYALAQ
ncbi:hypothetical protein HYW59_03805 [Candidatus Kaiserbacteria bacterium]|nr:hypothetical protein [Candidatus Kaiserbacteria bacterium]